MYNGSKKHAMKKKINVSAYRYIILPTPFGTVPSQLQSATIGWQHDKSTSLTLKCFSFNNTSKCSE